MEDHAHWMRRAIRLAMNGRGRVEPNPMVGCVIFKDGRVIGEGYHEMFGGPHAEPNALASCTESPADATVYTTLEPCCHTNKKTPPCVPRLIEAKVARVVIGCLDPNPQVNGQGGGQLRSAGIGVVAPVLEAECKQLLAPFIARVRYGRPYVTLKWAESRDQRVAGPGGRPVRISNDRSSSLVHQFRARSDGILVSIRTALNDDPMLTARGVEQARPLTRVVLDRNLDLPITGKLVATASRVPLLVFCSARAAKSKKAELATLGGFGAEVVPVPVAERRLSIDAVLHELAARGMTHLLVEPGPRLAQAMMDVADRIWVFRSPMQINDIHAPKAALVTYPPVGELDIAGDTLTEYVNPASPVYFAPTPSADFVLAAATAPADAR